MGSLSEISLYLIFFTLTDQIRDCALRVHAAPRRHLLTIQSLCVFMAGVRHKSSTLFQFQIARYRGPEALGAIHL